MKRIKFLTKKATNEEHSAVQKIDKISKNSLYSLRLRLFLSIISVALLFWCIGVGIMVFIAWSETNDAYDDMLEKSAKMLFHAASNDLKYYSEKEIPSRKHPDPDDVHYQIIINDKVVSHTKKAPISPFVKDYQNEEGFVDITINAEDWRVFVISANKGDVGIQVGQGMEMRLELLEDLAEDLILPSILILIILIAVTGCAIYYLLKPLTNLANHLKERSSRNFGEVPSQSRSKEIQAIIHSLNAYLIKLNTTLQNERRFTADAAHELRTPLAALGMKAQLLQRRHPVLTESLLELRQEINRSTHLVQSLLLLARLDPLEEKKIDSLKIEMINFQILFDEIIREFSNESARNSIQIIAYDNDVKFLANREMMEIMLRNLVRNAVIYCPEKSTIQLHAFAEQNQVKIIIQDDGNGVSDDEVTRIMDRFYRVLGTQKSGSGLGLSIVKRIVELHNGIIEVESGTKYQGLRFTIIFPIILQS